MAKSKTSLFVIMVIETLKLILGRVASQFFCSESTFESQSYSHPKHQWFPFQQSSSLSSFQIRLTYRVMYVSWEGKEQLNVILVDQVPLQRTKSALLSKREGREMGQMDTGENWNWTQNLGDPLTEIYREKDILFWQSRGKASQSKNSTRFSK